MMPAMRVIIADDDADMRLWLLYQLRTLGANVEEAADGSELLWALGERGPFDLVVTDVHMPFPDGRKVLAMARSASLMTPFLVISADAALSREVKSFSEASFLAKPLQGTHFVGTVRKLVYKETEEPREFERWRGRGLR
jgi:two-component system, NarL family, capsular synthesis sensor histidine kinase RcsC